MHPSLMKKKDAPSDKEKAKKDKGKGKEKAKAADQEKATPMEEEAADGEKDKDKPKTKKKKKIRRTDLKIDTVVVGSLPNDQLKGFTEKEAQMANQDRVVEETGEARNALESYVLEMRSKVQDEKELANYVKESDRDKFVEALTKVEDWLNEDGFDAQKSEYVSKLDELKKQGDPITHRKKEEGFRPERISALKSAIGRYHNFATSKDEKYAHIEDAEKKKVLKLANDTDQWLAQSLSKQDRVAKHEDPVLTSKSISDKLHELENANEPIVNKPKPKPKEEPKKEEPKNEKKDDKSKDKDKETDKEKEKEKEKENEKATKKAKTENEKDKDGAKAQGQAKMDTS